MKPIALFFILLLVLAVYPVFAQNDVDQAPAYPTADQAKTNGVEEEIISEDVGITPVGITPDRPFLYGLKRAREKISISLTFNRAAKAKRGLRYALLRKHEIAKMIEENKLDSAETALIGHEQNMANVKAAIANIKQDPEKELETAAELEDAVDAQEAEVAKIRIKIKGKGTELSAEQLETIHKLIQSLEDSNADVKIAIKVKSDKSEIKLRALKQARAEKAKKSKGKAKITGEAEGEEPSPETVFSIQPPKEEIVVSEVTVWEIGVFDDAYDPEIDGTKITETEPYVRSVAPTGNVVVDYTDSSTFYSVVVPVTTLTGDFSADLSQGAVLLVSWTPAKSGTETFSVTLDGITMSSKTVPGDICTENYNFPYPDGRCGWAPPYYPEIELPYYTEIFDFGLESLGEGVETPEEKTKVEISGDVELSEEAQATLDELVASFAGVEGKIELKLKVKKKDGEITSEAEIKVGELTAEQQELWETLQSQAEALVEAAEGDDIELEIEIEYELEAGAEEETHTLSINYIGGDGIGFDYLQLSTIEVSEPVECPEDTNPEFVETVTVPSDGNSVASTDVLEDGAKYLLEASGTYTYWPAQLPDAGIADAKYSLRPEGSYNPGPGPQWISGDDLPAPYTNYLEILVNEGAVAWGDFNEEHIYAILFDGEGAEVNFNMLDSSYNDNSGSLTVDVYECVEEEQKKPKNKIKIKSKIKPKKIGIEGGTIEMTISLKNKGKEKVQDAHVEIYAPELGIDITSDNFDLDVHEKIKMKFSLDIPKVEEGKYTIKSSVYDPKSNKYNVRYNKLKVENKNKIKIKSKIKPKKIGIEGGTVEMTIDLKNKGKEKVQDAHVEIYAPDLGIDITSDNFDLDVHEKIKMKFSLDIPKVEEGKYIIKSSVYDPKSNKYNVRYNKLKVEDK